MSNDDEHAERYQAIQQRVEDLSGHHQYFGGYETWIDPNDLTRAAGNVYFHNTHPEQVDGIRWEYLTEAEQASTVARITAMNDQRQADAIAAIDNLSSTITLESEILFRESGGSSEAASRQDDRNRAEAQRQQQRAAHQGWAGSPAPQPVSAGEILIVFALFVTLVVIVSGMDPVMVMKLIGG